MVLFNHATREMTAKIVYYGPGLCGKTTNLLVIFDKLDPKSRGKMLSLATKTDRTLFFDLLPVDIGKVGSFNLKIQLYTVPGQVFYNETRKLVLKGSDAIVFVADSQASMVNSTRDSFENLRENLRENQIDENELPIVIQYNKRDIPGVLPIEELQEQLGFEGYPYVEASAVQGEGVMETFKLISKLTAKHLLAKVQGKPSRGVGRSVAPRAAEPLAAAVEEVEPIEDAAPLEASWPVDAAFTAPSSDEPFDSAPDQRSYEKVEEVSLEQLLEGRERPATFAGNVAVPISAEDEVESLEEQQWIAPVEVEPASDSVAGLAPMPAADDDGHDHPAPDAILTRRVDQLSRQLDGLRADQQRLEQLLRDVASIITGALPDRESDH